MPERRGGAGGGRVVDAEVELTRFGGRFLRRWRRGKAPAMTKLIKSSHAVIPGWSEGPDPESQPYEKSQQLRDSGFAPSARPGMTLRVSSLPPAATIAAAA